MQRSQPAHRNESVHSQLHQKCMGCSAWQILALSSVGNVCKQLREAWWRTTREYCSHPSSVLRCNRFYLLVSPFPLSVHFNRPFFNLFLKIECVIAADQPGMWASSGEIYATSHLLECRIGCFASNNESGMNGWSWYPSISHYPDAPIILMYNINADHFLLVQRVKTAILIL